MDPNLPLQTVLEQSVAAATSAAASLLDQQYQQLQQERQQLQANYTLQQHVSLCYMVILATGFSLAIRSVWLQGHTHPLGYAMEVWSFATR